MDTPIGGFVQNGICVREVPTQPGTGGRHVCWDPATGKTTTDHYDEISPVKVGSRTNNYCEYDYGRAPNHILMEALPWQIQKYSGCPIADFMGSLKSNGVPIADRLGLMYRIVLGF